MADMYDRTLRLLLPDEVSDTKDVKLTKEEAFDGWPDRELAFWPPTAKEFDLADAVAYQKRQPLSKTTKVFDDAILNRQVLIQPRCGTVPIQSFIEMIHAMEDAGADIIGVDRDAFTRNLNFAQAQKHVDEAESTGKATLDGFPMIVCGVKGCRQISEATPLPMGRSTKTDPIRWAAGFMSGGMAWSPYQHLAYTQYSDMARVIRYEQQHARRAAYFEETENIPAASEVVNANVGTLVPPGISIATGVAGGLLAATQGIKTIIMATTMNGNLIQDAAALVVMKEIAQEYLKKRGLENVLVGSSGCHFMGHFPEDEARAYGVICMGTAAAVLGEANLVIPKTPEEAFGTPSLAAQVAAIKATRQVIHMLKNQSLRGAVEFEEEREILRLEARAILDAIFDLGKGDLAVGILKSLPAGVVDIPFSANKSNVGKVFPARDLAGAIRYLDVGQLPFGDRIVKYHQEKLAKRFKAHKRDYDAIVDDVFYISRIQLKQTRQGGR